MNGANRILRRGLDRGYIGFEQELRSPRGRLLIDRSLKEQSQLRAAVYCQIDELSHDVLHNQIIKATAASLARHRLIRPELAHQLRLIGRRFDDVSEIRIEPSHFRRVQLFRNNAQYTTLMRLCEFVYRSQLPDEAGAGARFADILEDEERMSRVFEDFLRNFYFFELQGRYSVGREDFRWDIDHRPGGDATLIPIMRTDVTLRSGERSIVMDAKFYAEPFPKSVGVAKLRSGHLYQLFSYMKHAGQRAAHLPISGALVYAAPSEGSLNRYVLDGHDFAVAVIDLSRPWPDVSRQLLDLIGTLEVSGGRPLVADGPSLATLETAR